MKEVKVGDAVYKLEPMTFGQGRDIFRAGVDTFDSNCAMIAACLNNADGGTRTPDNILALPYTHGSALVFACLDINGLRPAKPGEVEAAQTTDR